MYCTRYTYCTILYLLYLYIYLFSLRYRYNCMYNQHISYYKVYFYNALVLGTRPFSMVYCTVSIHNYIVLYSTVPCLHLYIHTQYLTLCRLLDTPYIGLGLYHLGPLFTQYHIQYRCKDPIHYKTPQNCMG